MSSNSLRKFTVLAFSFASLLCIAAGVGFAIRSPLFLVQVVEVGDQPENAPVSAQVISELAAVPVGKVNLFDLDLKSVEKRILTHPWIRQVNLMKRFPQTLSISVVFRDPQALIQLKSGSMAYVDTDGKVFGRVNVLARSNLPLFSGMFSGVAETDSMRIRQALELLARWEKSDLREYSRLSALGWDDERGYRAWVTYSVGAVKARTQVELGKDVDDSTSDVQFKRLSGVLRYLSQHSMVANQIWADSGKKIVVRTAHGS
jgi:hypothetical protein